MLKLRSRIKTADKGEFKLKVIYRDYRELTPDPRNTRTHSPEQIKQLEGSLLQFGWTQPLILHYDNIMAGHGRLLAYKSLRKQGKEVAGTHGPRVPCIQRDNMTEAERKAYVVADNRLAELAGWDMDLLKDELNLLVAQDGFDIKATGFDLSFIDVKAGHKPNKPKNNDTGVIDFRNDAEFPQEGEFGFSVIRKDRILDVSKVRSIATWAGPDSESRGATRWFYNVNSDSQIGLNWERTLLGFYVDDVRFEAWWNETPKYAQWAVNNKLWGAVGPNYSTYFDWPKAMRIYNIYRSRWVTRYLQEAGINVIPDISCAPDDLDETLAGLKGIKTIALQAHQKYETQDKLTQKKEVVECIMKVLKPETILLYAPGDRLRLFPALTKARIILVEPRSRVRQRRMAAKYD